MMRSHKKKLLACLISAALISGCGGGSSSGDDTTDNEQDTTDNDSQTGVSVDSQTSNYNVYLPDGVTQDSADGDFDGVMVYAGDDSSTSTAISLLGVESGGATTARDVAGFVAETEALNSETGAGELVSTYANAIQADTAVDALSSTSTRVATDGSTAVAKYRLTLVDATKPTDLANALVQLVGVNKAGGTITNLPSALSSETLKSTYLLNIGVLYASASEVVVTLTVVPEDVSGNYSTLTSKLSDTANVVSKTAGDPVSATDSFTAQAGSGKADFLFVIDNSGSMREEQDAISEAATQFDSAISSSGLDYHVATITTDSSDLRDTNGDGGFTTDLTEFESDVTPGTSGDHTESGIWFAEQALLSSAEGDASDGSVVAEGYPRENASLSIIMMSDEPDYYSDWFTTNGGDRNTCDYDSTTYTYTCFDTSDNLFIDRGYRVYSIVDTNKTFEFTLSDGTTSSSDNYRYGEKYVELATNTAGTTADITAIDEEINTSGSSATMQTIMHDIAVAAGGATSMFVLDYTPISAEGMSVSVNGSEVTESDTNGWSYNSGSNSIVFHGSSIPAGGDAVEVSYYHY